jgi:hypothetical protein
MIVDEVMLREEGPSVLSCRQLYCWTKYRVGAARGNKFRYGAVKPPDPKFHWFPAAIGEEFILVASSRSFPTPEKAVAWLRRQGHVGRKSRVISPRPQTRRGSRR